MLILNKIYYLIFRLEMNGQLWNKKSLYFLKLYLINKEQ